MMKLLAIFFALFFVTFAPAAQAKTHKKVPVAKSRSTKTAKSKSPSSRARTYVKGKHGKRGHYVAATAPRAPTRQGQPTPDRFREIQQALVTKGYLKTEPSGVWDADSQEAMRRFQSDQKLDQTGKLNARSLIFLGLGPKSMASAASPSDIPAVH